MKTDTIFYQLFQTFPSLLFELIGESPEQAEGYEFSSREIKERAFRFDGVFLPPTKSTNQPIYFVEVQFQPKSDFYWRFFTENFLYLGQYKPNNDWRAVAVFASRNLDPGLPMQYRAFLMSQQLTFVYLDELEETPSSSLGLGIVQLVVGDEETAIEQTNRLMQQARQELTDEAFKRKVLELIETILIYKFIALSRQELEAMFGLDDLKQTRYFREVAAEAEQKGKLEGKLETVPLLLELGLSMEEIAQRLNLDEQTVRRAAQGQSTTDTAPGEATGI